jgi:hypothetical protein
MRQGDLPIRPFPTREGNCVAELNHQIGLVHPRKLESVRLIVRLGKSAMRDALSFILGRSFGAVDCQYLGTSRPNYTHTVKSLGARSQGEREKGGVFSPLAHRENKAAAITLSCAPILQFTNRAA